MKPHWRSLGLAALSGFAASLSFPSWISPGFNSWSAWVAWFALVPLFFAIEGRKPGEAALAGWIAGLFFFTSSLYWVAAIEELSFLRVPALLGLSAVLALYWMVWALVVRKAGPGRAMLAAPAAWALLEIIRGRLFTGFPWVLMGASQYSMPSVFLAARYVGVCGISVCVLSVNCAFWLLLCRDPRASRAVLAAAVLVLSLSMLSVLGRISIEREDRTAASLRVAVLQGNFSEKEKWYLPGDDLIRRYEDLSGDAAAAGAKVMVWPETAVARDVISDPGFSRRIARVAERTGAMQIVGTILARSDSVFYNAAYSVSKDGPQGSYMKMHLVPFGEYVPRWVRVLLPFTRKLTQGMQDYSAGGRPSLLPAGGGVSAGAAICYEAIFPEHGRMLVREGAEIFVNLTNDAWYGRTAASWQHALGPVSRAVECGRWMVRSANTGVSMVVSPSGRIVGRLGLFSRGVIVEDVKVLGGRTVYAVFGDTIVIVYLGLAFAVLALARRKKGKHEPA